MARATGKATKKKRKRHNPRRSKKIAAKSPPTSSTSAPDPVKIYPDWVTIYAFNDLRDGDPFANDSPAFNRPALLPELVSLQLMAVRYFKLCPPPRGPEPSKETLIDFFMNVPLSNRKLLSRHHAEVMATFVRSVSAMGGGRPRKQPNPPALDEVFHEELRGDGPVSENG